MAVNEKLLSIKIQTDAETKTIAGLQKNIVLLTKERNNLNKKIRQGITLTKKEETRLGQLQSELVGTRNKLRDMERQVVKNNNALKKNSGFVAGIKKGIGQFATSALGLVAVFGAITKAVSSAFNVMKDFEQSQANLRAVTGKTEKELKALTKQAKQLGATTAFTATQATEAQTELAKLGFTVKEITQLTPAVLDLAAASGTDLANAATIAGSTVRGFGLEASETQRVVDVMANSFTKSSLDIEKFSTAMAAVAPVANSAGVGVEETTALLGTLTDAGIDASTAGTGLRNVFLELSKSGMTFEEAMSEIQNATDKNAVSLDLFGKRGAVIGTVLAENTDKSKMLTQELLASGGAAEKMAKEQLDTLEGKLTLLGSAWEGFILGLDDGEGVISDISKGFVDLATNLLGLLTPSESLADSYLRQKEEVTALNSQNRTLADRYDELKGKAKLSKDEQTELDTIIQQLAENVPSAITQFDKYGKALDISTGAVRRNAEQQENLLKIKNKEAIEEQEAALKLLNQQQERLNFNYKMNGDELTVFDKELKKYLKASDEEIENYQQKTYEIQSNIDGTKTLIAELKGLETEEQKKAKEEKKRAEERAAQAKKDQEEAEEKEKQSKKAAEEEAKRLKELQKVIDSYNESLSKKIEFENDDLRIIKEKNDELKEALELNLFEDEELSPEELAAEKAADFEIEQAKRVQEEKNSLRKETIDAAIQLEQQFFNIFNELQNRKLNEIENNKQTELESLEDKFGKGLISEEQYNAEKVNLERKYTNEAAKVRERQAKFSKAQAVINAGINTASAIAQINANPAVNADITQTLRGTLTALVSSIGAAQIATILAKPIAKFQKGGMLNGPSHAQGGIPFSVGGKVGFEAEGGEAIINKKSTQMFAPLLSAINQAGGGVAFANGGRVFASGGIPVSTRQGSAVTGSTFNDGMSNLGDMMQDVVSRIEVVNVATNTTGVATEVQNIQSEASF